jgi:hypothetical protein
MRLGLWNLQRGGRHGAAYGRQVRLHTIDLICGPSAQPLHHVGRVDPMVDGRRLSDHAAYWVELDVG